MPLSILELTEDRGGTVVGASTVEKGRWGEDRAADHLREAGYEILARNWHSPVREVAGEIDIVALQDDVLVVCEVKARRGSGFGTPAEAVTPTKQRRLRRLASVWLAGRREDVADRGTDTCGPSWFREMRFDVLGVPLSGDGQVEHIRGAF